MPRRATTAVPTFKLLVGHHAYGSDPSRGVNAPTIRHAFVQQYFPEVPGRGEDKGPGTTDWKTPGTGTRQGKLTYPKPPATLEATGIITVQFNDFALPTTLYLGKYTLVSGEDYAVGVTALLTAASLAAAIDALLEYSASVFGAVITVYGPVGPDGNDARFEVSYAGATQNFLLAPDSGSLELGTPVIGPPEIIK